MVNRNLFLRLIAVVLIISLTAGIMPMSIYAENIDVVTNYSVNDNENVSVNNETDSASIEDALALGNSSSSSQYFNNDVSSSDTSDTSDASKINSTLGEVLGVTTHLTLVPNNNNSNTAPSTSLNPKSEDEITAMLDRFYEIYADQFESGEIKNIIVTDDSLYDVVYTNKDESNLGISGNARSGSLSSPDNPDGYPGYADIKITTAVHDYRYYILSQTYGYTRDYYTADVDTDSNNILNVVMNYCMPGSNYTPSAISNMDLAWSINGGSKGKSHYSGARWDNYEYNSFEGEYVFYTNDYLSLYGTFHMCENTTGDDYSSDIDIKVTNQLPTSQDITITASDILGSVAAEDLDCDGYIFASLSTYYDTTYCPLVEASKTGDGNLHSTCGCMLNPSLSAKGVTAGFGGWYTSNGGSTRDSNMYDIGDNGYYLQTNTFSESSNDTREYYENYMCYVVTPTSSNTTVNGGSSWTCYIPVRWYRGNVNFYWNGIKTGYASDFNMKSVLNFCYRDGYGTANFANMFNVDCSSSNTNVATVSGGTISVKGSGITTLTIKVYGKTAAGTTCYNPKTITVNLTINSDITSADDLSIVWDSSNNNFPPEGSEYSHVYKISVNGGSDTSLNNASYRWYYKNKPGTTLGTGSTVNISNFKYSLSSSRTDYATSNYYSELYNKLGAEAVGSLVCDVTIGGTTYTVIDDEGDDSDDTSLAFVPLSTQNTYYISSLTGSIKSITGLSSGSLYTYTSTPVNKGTGIKASDYTDDGSDYLYFGTDVIITFPSEGSYDFYIMASGNTANSLQYSTVKKITINVSYPPSTISRADSSYTISTKSTSSLNLTNVFTANNCSISYSASSSNVKINSNTVTCTTPGTYTITASGTGNTGYKDPNSVSITLYVKSKATTIAASTTSYSTAYNGSSGQTFYPWNVLYYLKNSEGTTMQTNSSYYYYRLSTSSTSSTSTPSSSYAKLSSSSGSPTVYIYKPGTYYLWVNATPSNTTMYDEPGYTKVITYTMTNRTIYVSNYSNDSDAPTLNCNVGDTINPWDSFSASHPLSISSTSIDTPSYAFKSSSVDIGSSTLSNTANQPSTTIGDFLNNVDGSNVEVIGGIYPINGVDNGAYISLKLTLTLNDGCVFSNTGTNTRTVCLKVRAKKGSASVTFYSTPTIRVGEIMPLRVGIRYVDSSNKETAAPWYSYYNRSMTLNEVNAISSVSSNSNSDAKIDGSKRILTGLSEGSGSIFVTETTVSKAYKLKYDPQSVSFNASYNVIKCTPVIQNPGWCHNIVAISNSLPKKNKLMKVPITAI